MESYIWTLSPAGMGLCVLAAEVGRIIKPGTFVEGGKWGEMRGKVTGKIISLILLEFQLY